ncbi:MAG: hypothetical protein JNM14_14275, partial [Ferruginibacter sp.]|nr:hypothetical protein [Ferruginibacter sp.]
MKTITQITQSHLSVFVFDKANNNPIKRMPMFAEIAVIGKKIPETINTEDIQVINDILGNGNTGEWIRKGIEKYFGAVYFNDLTNDEKKDLVDKIVEEAKAMMMGQENIAEQKKKKITEDAIKKIAAEVGVNMPPDAEIQFETLGAYPLGMLATDHAGYLSYSLKNVPKNPFPLFNELQYAIYLYPMGKEAAKIDALEQGRITPDAIVAKLEIEKPLFEANLKALNLPAMQNPDLADWYMSPGSFAALPSALIGADGCENLFPANFATQEFRFRQVVRLTAADSPVGFPSNYRYGYLDEYKVTLLPIGHSLGEIKYSLPLAPGESVKLAIIDWSRMDSSARTEDNSLKEQLYHNQMRDRTITETATAALREMQSGNSGIDKSDFSAGKAISGAASGALAGVAAGPFGVIAGALVGGIGGGLTGDIKGTHSTSTGSRDVATKNVQKLTDSFSQASSVLKEYHSTVVVQAKHEEKESIQTRTFTNYNHSHTLTILYYEILRHFRLVTEWVNRKPVALLPYDKVDFGGNDCYQTIVKFRYLLEPYLIDKSLTGAFSSVEKLLLLKDNYRVNQYKSDQDNFEPVKPEAETEFKFFNLGLKTGIGVNANIQRTPIEHIGSEILTPGGTLNGVIAFLVLHSGEHLMLKRYQVNNQGGGEYNLNYDRRLYNHNFLNWQLVVAMGNDVNGVLVERQVKWKDIAGIVLENIDGDDAWLCEWVELKGICKDMWGKITLIKLNESQKFDALLLPKSRHSITAIIPPGPQNLIAPKFEKNFTQEERFAIERLKEHLITNSAYYNQIIQFNRDINERTEEFETNPWGLTPNNDNWVDHVEPIALEVFGSMIAYPMIVKDKYEADKLKEIYDAIVSNDPEKNQWALEQMKSFTEHDFENLAVQTMQVKAKTEKLISFPTKGIFAEGKLGHCNISEEIDETRFWKWEEHPIPINAPDINPVTAVTPQLIQQNVQPTPFPNSSINIVSPSAAPDPQGLAEALKILGTSNIFRDMSGRQETADLIKKLSEGSISLDDAKSKAKEIETK